MSSDSIVIYLPEGFADWEGAFLMAELKESQTPFTVISESGDAVTSLAGLKVTVNKGLKDIDPAGIRMLVLIGSDGWADATLNRPALNLAGELLKSNRNVAAICGATNALAREGHLNSRRHTSNDLMWLKKSVPEYKGESHYVDDVTAVTDGNLITAPGVAPIDFTFHVMAALDLYTPTKRRQWFELYKKGVKPPMEFWA